ncbi:MAG: alpha/beta hydrolase family protein [Myxococcota bacterium]
MLSQSKALLGAFLAFLLWVSLPGVAQAAQNPSKPGPYTVKSVELLEDRDGVMTNFDLYMPATAGRYPAVVLGHGFSQHKAYQADNAMHLASWGFVVLVPTFSSYSDHEANGAEMLDLLDWLISSANPYRSLVDETRLGLAGHSAGGLATTVAAGLDAQTSNMVSAVMGLDPVDASNLGLTYAKTIAAPLFYIVGISYKCNSNGNSQTMYSAVPTNTDKMYLRIPTSVHCDFNTQGLDEACSPDAKPARPLKVIRLLATQGWDAGYEAATAGSCAVDGMTADRSLELGIIHEYLAAWFLSNLADQTWAAAWLYDGAEVTRDVNAGLVKDLQY